MISIFTSQILLRAVILWESELRWFTPLKSPPLLSLVFCDHCRTIEQNKDLRHVNESLLSSSITVKILAAVISCFILKVSPTLRYLHFHILGWPINVFHPCFSDIPLTPVCVCDPVMVLVLLCWAVLQLLPLRASFSLPSSKSLNIFFLFFVDGFCTSTCILLLPAIGPS